MRPSPGPLLAPGPVLLVAPLAQASPIPPVALWQLAQEAELIVVARVAAVELDVYGDSDVAPDVARLEVLEVWKGSPSGEIPVTFRKSAVCPAPARYVPGETVLTFLARGETLAARLRASPRHVRRMTALWAGHWFTIGASYGTLYHDADDRALMHDLVDDAIVLQGTPPVPEAERRAWHIRAASRRATRWHGLDPLRPVPEGLQYFYGLRPWSPPTTDERLEVMRGFVAEPSDDETLAMTLAFAGAEPDPEFDHEVLGQVERLLLEASVPHWLEDALARLAERFGSTNGRADLGLPEPGRFRPSVVTLRRSWQRTLERYGIPNVPPAMPPVSRHPPE